MRGTDANLMGQSARPYLSPHGQSGPTQPFLPGKGRLAMVEVSRETMYDAPASAVSLNSPVPTGAWLGHSPRHFWLKLHSADGYAARSQPASGSGGAAA